MGKLGLGIDIGTRRTGTHIGTGKGRIRRTTGLGTG